MLTEEVIYEASPVAQQTGQGGVASKTCQSFFLGVVLSVAMPSGNVTASEFQQLTSIASYSSGRGAEVSVGKPATRVTAVAPMVAEVSEALSLTTTQTAKALRVSRQRVYDYRKGQEASPETIERLQMLVKIARYWKDSNAGSLSGKIALPFADGVSLIELLSAPDIDEEAVRDRFGQLADFLRGVGSSPFEPRPSMMDELKAHGVSEPTEEERFIRREDDRIRHWLQKDETKE